MAQIPYSTGIKPLVKPVAKPAGNPADRNFFSGSAVPVAPKVAPTVNMVRPSGPTPTNNFFNYTPPAPAAPKDNFLRGSKASSNPYMAQEFAKANADPNPGLRLPQYTSPPMPNSVGGTVARGVADLTRIIPPVIASAAGPAVSGAVAGGSEALAQWWENQVGLRSGYSQEQLAGTALMGGLFSNWGGKPVTTGVFPDLPTSGVVQNPAFAWARGGVPTQMPGFGEFVGAQIRDAQKNSRFTGVDPRYQMLPGITTRPSNLLQGHVLEYGSRMKMLQDAIERTNKLGKFNPNNVTIRQDVAGVMGNMPGSKDYKPFAGRDIYLAELPNGDTIPMASSSQSNIKRGVDERGSIFPLGGIQYTGGYNGMGPGWFMKNYETIDAANASPYMQDLYSYVKPMNALWPRLPNGDPNTLIEHGSLQETLRTIFGRVDKTINYDDPNVVQDIMNSIQDYEYFQRQNLQNHMARMSRQ